MYDTSPLPPANTPVPPEASPNEEPTPMLDVHPAHHAANTWRDFFIHIATIVVGLFIAVGLEQTVEYFHHRHQLRDLQQQMHDVLEYNLQADAQDFLLLADMRSSLLDIRTRLNAQPGRPAPTPSGRRMTDSPRLPNTALRLPSIAPYEAAKENGTVALLPSEDIRVYNRLALQRDFQIVDVREWNDSMRRLDSFEERFVDSSGDRLFLNEMPSLDLARLYTANREEYRALVADVIKNTDIVTARVRLFDFQCRAVLDGERDENKLYLKSTKP